MLLDQLSNGTFRPTVDSEATRAPGNGEFATNFDPRRPVLFIQPFGISDLGGGARILRSLLELSPVKCVSIVTAIRSPNPTELVEQIHCPTRPNFGRIEHTRFCRWPASLTPVWRRWHRRAVRRLIRRLRPRAIHLMVQPGCDFTAIIPAARAHNVPLAASFHDHPNFFLQKGQFNTENRELLGDIWRDVQRRFVISQELGGRLCHDYGPADFELVTDGVERFGNLNPLGPKLEYTVYFMGLFHEFYRENFSSLISALQHLGEQIGVYFNLHLRTNCFPAIESGSRVRIQVSRPAPDDTVSRDMENADFMYLPLPFSEAGRAFSDYSLSTKMISFLASGKLILYHGPEAAAAGRLLHEHCAAICVTDLAPTAIETEMYEILKAPQKAIQLTTSALALARSHFHIDAIRSRFWESLISSVEGQR